MAHTACLDCFISTVNGHCNKKKEKKEKKMKLTLGRLALVVGTQQTYFETFDIYGFITSIYVTLRYITSCHLI